MEYVVSDQGPHRIPPTQVLDPDIFGVTNRDMYDWRKFLKLTLLRRREFKSDLSGALLRSCEMHEGILTRANVPKSIWWHFKLYHEYNCFLLLPEEHRPSPPSREQCIEIAYSRYGRETIRYWYYSLPFKARPFELP